MQKFYVVAASVLVTLILLKLIPKYWYANVLSLINLACGIIALYFGYSRFN